MSDSVRLIQRPHSGTTPEQARAARAWAWAFVFKCWDAKKGEQRDLTTKAARQAEGANQGRKG